MADKYYFAPLKPREPQEGMGLYRHGTGACIYYSGGGEWHRAELRSHWHPEKQKAPPNFRYWG